jgi:hypothetical protein
VKSIHSAVGRKVSVEKWFDCSVFDPVPGIGNIDCSVAAVAFGAPGSVVGSPNLVAVVH